MVDKYMFVKLTLHKIKTLNLVQLNPFYSCSIISLASVLKTVFNYFKQNVL